MGAKKTAYDIQIAWLIDDNTFQKGGEFENAYFRSRCRGPFKPLDPAFLRLLDTKHYPAFFYEYPEVPFARLYNDALEAAALINKKLADCFDAGSIQASLLIHSDGGSVNALRKVQGAVKNLTDRPDCDVSGFVNRNAQSAGANTLMSVPQGHRYVHNDAKIFFHTASWRENSDSVLEPLTSEELIEIREKEIDEIENSIILSAMKAGLDSNKLSHLRSLINKALRQSDAEQPEIKFSGRQFASYQLAIAGNRKYLRKTFLDRFGIKRKAIQGPIDGFFEYSPYNPADAFLLDD